MEASFGTGATGRAALEWVPDSIAIIGSDGEGAFTQHYFDPRGIVRVYAMTFSDGVWNLLRDLPDFTPLEFSQRFTGGSRAAGDSISGRWEISDDGSAWEHDFDLTYRRVG